MSNIISFEEALERKHDADKATASEVDQAASFVPTFDISDAFN